MYYSHLSGFFSFFVFSQNSGRKEKCRRQVSQAPGLRSEGSREAGRSSYCRLALGSVPESQEQGLKPQREQMERLGRQLPQFCSSPVPWVATLEGSRSGALEAPMFGGLVSKAQAHRGQTEGGGGRDQHRGAVSSVGVPLGTSGPWQAGAVRMRPCLSANQLLQEGLQLVFILDPHKLVHHVPILHGQYGGYS